MPNAGHIATSHEPPLTCLNRASAVADLHRATIGWRSKGNWAGAEKCSGLPFRSMHNQTIEVRYQLDLAGQARIAAYVEPEIQHVFFHRGRPTHSRLPGRIDVDMTGRAGTGPAAFSLDTRDIVLDRRLHDGRTDVAIHGAGGALVIDKSDFCHGRLGHRRGRICQPPITARARRRYG